MVVIELGDVAGSDAEPGVPSRPGRPDPSALPRRAWRTLASAAAAALVLATVVAGGPQPPGAYQLGDPLWTDQVVRSFGFGAVNVYVPTADGLIARDGATGVARWAVTGDEMNFWQEDQGLVFLSEGVPQDDDGTGMRTLILDAATGAERLRYPAFPVGLTEDGQVAVVFQPGRACGGEDFCTRLLGIRLATGAPAWQATLTPTTQWSLDGLRGAGRLRQLLIQGDGVAQLWDARTGAVLARLTLPAATDDVPVSVASDSDGFVVATGAATQVRVARYRPGSTEPVWTVALGPNAQPGPDGFGVVALGEVVVVYRHRLLTVLDAKTGARRFDVEADNMTPMGAGYVVTRVFDAGPAEPGSMSAAIRDAATGAVVASLPAIDVYEVRDRPDLALVLDGTDARMVVRLVDRTGRTLLVDAINGAKVNCLASGDLLACADLSGQLRVWPLPTGSR